jgi:membrane-associated phospholipid phosphatase
VSGRAPTRRPLLLAVLGLLGFLSLAAIVLAHPGPLPLDRWLHRLAVEHRRPIVGIAGFWTNLGEGLVIFPLLLLAGVVCARRTGRWVVVLVGPLLLLAGLAVRFAAMAVIDRPRPPRVDWVRFASGQSFPSGHTTTAALGYGLVLLLLVGSVRRPAAKAMLGVLLLGVAGLVGVSRVVLGVHWPTDVLGGWSLALCAASLSALVLGNIDDRHVRVEGCRDLTPAARTSSAPSPSPAAGRATRRGRR